MLTTVILEGAFGKAFGREWKFAINSPREAIAMLEANKPGVKKWIRDRLEMYSHYKVICEYADGRTAELSEDEYANLEAKPDTIRFVPLITGAGAVGKIIGGVVLIVIGAVMNYFAPGSGSFFISMGISMLVGGVIEALTPRPKKDQIQHAQRSDKTSYYFDGPANTTGQGVPVQLVYGCVKVGSHAISAGVSVDQLM